jgi:poly(A) polymerase
VRLAWTASGEAAGDAAWQRTYTLPDRWQAPSFPLRGADLMALGLQGPQIGEALRRLERDWIAADFSPTRDDLLAKAR